MSKLKAETVVNAITRQILARIRKHNNTISNSEKAEKYLQEHYPAEWAVVLENAQHMLRLHDEMQVLYSSTHRQCELIRGLENPQSNWTIPSREIPRLLTGKRTLLSNICNILTSKEGIPSDYDTVHNQVVISYNDGVTSVDDIYKLLELESKTQTLDPTTD